MTRHVPALLVCAAIVTAAGLAGPAAAELYMITVENLIPGGPDTGQPMTPPCGVVHDAGYSLFAPGDFATPGLELLAEDGDPSVLVGEAGASASVFAVEVGGGPFFGSVDFTIQGDPGDLFSLVTMLARTNDLIAGVRNVSLPAGSPVEILTGVYDAGTEMNTGLIEHIPFYGNPHVGPDESQAIAGINTYTVLNDPVHGPLTWSFPPSARVTIARAAVPVEPASWGSIKATWSR